MALNIDLPLKDANDFVAGWLIVSLQYKDADNVKKKIQRVPPTYGSLIYLTHRTPPPDGQSGAITLHPPFTVHLSSLDHNLTQGTSVSF